MFDCFPGECQDTACVNARRVDFVKQQCAAYKDEPGDVDFQDVDATYDNLIVDDHLKMFYCSMGKAGTTTFLYMMENKYDHDKSSTNVHRPARLKACGLYRLSTVTNTTERKRILDSYRAFIVVRNPYVRLYSGYLQKSAYLERFLDGYMKTKHDNGATRRTVNNHYPEMGKKRDFISFETFLKIIVLSQTTTLKSLSRTRKNGHFVSIWKHCHPCHIRYDYIAKFETLSNDKNLFLPLFNVTDLPHFNSATGTKKGIGGNLRKAKILDPVEAIQQIPAKTLKEIAAVYMRDIEVFGYGLDSERTPYSMV